MVIIRVVLALFSFFFVCCGGKNDGENLKKFFDETQSQFKSSVDEILKNKEVLDSHFSIKAADGSFSLAPFFLATMMIIGSHQNTLIQQ